MKTYKVTLQENFATEFVYTVIANEIGTYFDSVDLHLYGDNFDNNFHKLLDLVFRFDAEMFRVENGRTILRVNEKYIYTIQPQPEEV